MFTTRRSSNKPFYLAADRRDAADKAVRERTTREALQQLETAVQDARAAESLNAAHAESGGTLARWQRTLRVRFAAHAAGKPSARSWLIWLTYRPSPSNRLRNGARRWTMMPRRVEMSRWMRRAQPKWSRSLMAVDEKLLSEGVTIDALRERLLAGAVRKAIDDLPRRRVSAMRRKRRWAKPRDGSA